MVSYLNTKNIARSKDGVEYHPLTPFLPENAKVLFLGSFPPQRKRWCMDFYYPNFINDHWRIEGQIFFGDKNHFVDLEAKRFKIDEIVAFCQEKGLAFFDTCTAIRRLQDNASDKFLEVVEPTDIPSLLRQLPHCFFHLTSSILPHTSSSSHRPLAPPLFLTRLSAGFRQESGSLSPDVRHPLTNGQPFFSVMYFQ